LVVAAAVAAAAAGQKRLLYLRAHATFVRANLGPDLLRELWQAGLQSPWRHQLVSEEWPLDLRQHCPEAHSALIAHLSQPVWRVASVALELHK